MELRHLRYFLTVAEELHFGRAASRLHLSQPPLSQQILQLEAELGVTLFQRSHRRVRLTEAGEAYRHEIQNIFAHLEEAGIRARQVEAGDLGTLAVGFVPSTTYSLLPRIYQRFRQLHPRVALTLAELSTAEQVEALHEGRIQVGLARPPISDTTLTMQLLAEEALILAAPAAHTLAKLHPLSLGALTAEHFILFPRNPRPGWIDVVLGACESAGFTPQIIQEVQELSSAITLVAAGLGIALVPASAEALSLPGVVYRHFDTQEPKTRLLALHRMEENNALVEHFLTVAREVVQGEQ